MEAFHSGRSALGSKPNFCFSPAALLTSEAGRQIVKGLRHGMNQIFAKGQEPALHMGVDAAVEARLDFSIRFRNRASKWGNNPFSRTFSRSRRL